MSEHYNLEFADYPRLNHYGFPPILPVHELDYPDRWIEFDYAHRNRNRANTGIHFYERDYKFSRVWEQPNKYIPLLQSYKCVLSPDFSMYADYPKAIQIHNLYMNCWCARFWQDKGITVIPSVMWVDKDSYDWCFEGMPHNSIVSVSTVGNMQNQQDRDYWMSGYNEMLNRLNPSEILVFSRDFKWDLEGNVHWIKWTLRKGEQLDNGEDE